MVKYACKVTSSRCLSQSFTAVHEDIPKCMPEEHLLLEPVKLDIRGFESRRAPKAYRQWFGFVLRDARRQYAEGKLPCYANKIRYHSAKREMLWHISWSNAKRALPGSGYRVIPIGAKRSLSAPCRKYLSFQPLLLHE